MYKLRVIKDDGSERMVESDKHHPSLEELQELVGGYIEHFNTVYKGDWADVIVNEDGLPLGLPYNAVASLALSRSLVGTVVIFEQGKFD